MAKPLAGRAGLVACGTRAAGRGTAVQLGAAGATVYVTGRSSRAHRSEMNRPETIEETAELVDQAGGRGIAVEVDHLVPEEVRELVRRIEAEQAALHIWSTTSGVPLRWSGARRYGNPTSIMACARCAWAWTRTPSPAISRFPC